MNTKAKTAERKLFKNLFYDLVALSGAIPGLIFLHPRFLYKSPDAKKRIRGGALVICNHISFFDPVYLLFAIWYRRQRFLCIKELCTHPLADWFFRMARCIPIDRENMNMDSMRQIIDALKNGEIVTMFPEGKINDSGEPLETFKSGAVLMSVMSGKPIVPVYIHKKPGFGGLTVVMGEALDPRILYGPRPTSAQLGEISRLLHLREQELINIYEEAQL